jgi:hypothetical protein
MTESLDGPAGMRWAHRLEELDREIARMALLCRVRILDPGVLERVLRNDPSVCETPNPIAFAKLHGLLMVHLALWKQSADALGEAQKAQIEAHIIERLRKSFPAIADEWPHAS